MRFTFIMGPFISVRTLLTSRFIGIIVSFLFAAEKGGSFLDGGPPVAYRPVVPGMPPPVLIFRGLKGKKNLSGLGCCVISPMSFVQFVKILLDLLCCRRARWGGRKRLKARG